LHYAWTMNRSVRAPKKATALAFATMVAILVPATLALVGCNTLQASAAKDPQKCERDPKCKDKRGKAADCSTQCTDDPACVARCREASGTRW